MEKQLPVAHCLEFKAQRNKGNKVQVLKAESFFQKRRSAQLLLAERAVKGRDAAVPPSPTADCIIAGS